MIVPRYYEDLHTLHNKSLPNRAYYIPADPPYVPQDNPCGAYVRCFHYRRDETAPPASCPTAKRPGFWPSATTWTSPHWRRRFP